MRRYPLKISTVGFVSALAIGSIFSTGAICQDTPTAYPLAIVKYELVSKARIGRTQFEYEYRPTIDNHSNLDFENLRVVFNSPDDSVELIDDIAGIEHLNAFTQAAAKDTIRVKIDRVTTFNPNTLSAFFDDNSLDGIDINADGIRDDIGQYIEKKYPTDSTVKKIYLNLARLGQSLLTQGPDNETLLSEAQSEGDALICLSLVESDFRTDYLEFNDLLIDTLERFDASAAVSTAIALAEPMTVKSTDAYQTLCQNLYGAQ